MSEQQNHLQSLEEIDNSLYKKGATDGLPINTPTSERVEEMLAGTDLPADHVIGRLGNKDNPLTVKRLATNGVMAGCSPLHMPVLVAGAKALADPESNSVQFSVSTGSWAYMWILNGPIRNDIDIQSGTGAFGPGFRSNMVIGRALGLAYKNTTQIHPGEKDMATIGNPFKYSMVAGENEEQTPWEPYHVTHGFEKEESTITLAGPNAFIPWTPHQNDAKHVLEGMVYHMSTGMTGGAIADRKKKVMQVLCPYNAEELSNAGLSKQEVKEYICDNSYISTNKYARGKWGDNEMEQVDDGKVPSLQLPQIHDPEYVDILTIGGGGRFNATIGPTLGPPVTKKIEFPENWEDLLEKYSHTLERDWYQASQFYD
ncbi:hypothetical protein [Natronorubrum sp. FCH18a]|uniref:hypothetical protein n=1 Tax=Natronorubrum sp. FCH18a TaxID=3447018 RepID=UPI003F51A89B